MLNKPAIIIIGGSFFSCPAVLAAIELGLLPLVVDRNMEAPAMAMALKSPGMAIAADIYNPATILERIERLKETFDFDIKGCATFGHDVEVQVAEVAEALKLPGIPINAARACKIKQLTRIALDKACLATPAWSLVDSLSNATQAASRIGYPVIVKATDNCASRGSTIVERAGDLQPALKKARAASSVPSMASVLIEQVLVGSEHSVEILFDGTGKCHRLNIVDRLFTIQNGVPIESGHVSPSKLSATKRWALYELAEQAAAAVGVQWGPFKIDAMITKNGPVVLEATARLSGGFDSSHTFGMATGRNSIKAAMQVACGMPFEPEDLRPRWQKFAACFAPLDGTEQSCADRKEFRLAVADTWEGALAKAKAGGDGVEVIRR